MVGDQCLVTRIGEKRPRHTLKTIVRWPLQREKENETYITMAEYLNPTRLYLIQHDQKEKIDWMKWKTWKHENNLEDFSKNDLWTY